MTLGPLLVTVSQLVAIIQRTIGSAERCCLEPVPSTAEIAEFVHFHFEQLRHIEQQLQEEFECHVHLEDLRWQLILPWKILSARNLEQNISKQCWEQLIRLWQIYKLAVDCKLQIDQVCSTLPLYAMHPVFKTEEYLMEIILNDPIVFVLIFIMLLPRALILLLCLICRPSR